MQILFVVPITRGVPIKYSYHGTAGSVYPVDSTEQIIEVGKNFWLPMATKFRFMPTPGKNISFSTFRKSHYILS